MSNDFSGILKLKVGKDFQYKNDKNMTIIYKDKYQQLEVVINTFLLFNPIKSSFNENVYFVLNYDDIIPKTSRLLFVKKNSIKKKKDLPWKSVRFFNSETSILYGIKEKEWLKFKEILKKILENKYYISKDFFESASSKEKTIILKLSKFIGKKDYINNSNNLKIQNDLNGINCPENTPILLILIPLECNELEKIFNEMSLNNEILDRFYDLNYVIIKKSGFDKIMNNCPWLVKECNLYDESGISFRGILNHENMGGISKIIKLPKPDDLEPIIGVIDSGNNLSGDFKNYITSENHLEPGKSSYYSHGNIVTSLVVANDELNPTHCDGLGNFKVKHFEILGLSGLKKRSVSFDHLIKKIPQFLEENKNIKVWNFSIGNIASQKYRGNISPLGLLLDHLSSKYNVLFIVSSGNDAKKYFDHSLNSPADSFSCLSVGSCIPIKNKNNDTIIDKAPYSSFGRVCGYIKPEIVSFGGPDNLDFSKLKAVDVTGDIITSRELAGTSFAAPRITRLAAWLFQNGYDSSLEVKAKIINSTKYSVPTKSNSNYGYFCIENSINQFDVKFVAEIENIRPYFYPINLNGIKFISISSAIAINYDRMLGDEYSITDFEFDIYKIKKNWREILIKKGDKEFFPESPDQVKSPNKVMIKSIGKCNKGINFKKSDIEFYGLKEKHLRTCNNKFFSSKKKVYDLTKQDKIDDNSEWMYMIKFKRMNLMPNDAGFELNLKPLKVSAVIDLFGEINKKDFFNNNEEIINVVETEVDIST